MCRWVWMFGLCTWMFPSHSIHHWCTHNLDSEEISLLFSCPNITIVFLFPLFWELIFVVCNITDCCLYEGTNMIDAMLFFSITWRISTQHCIVVYWCDIDSTWVAKPTCSFIFFRISEIYTLHLLSLTLLLRSLKKVL